MSLLFSFSPLANTLYTAKKNTVQRLITNRSVIKEVNKRANLHSTRTKRCTQDHQTLSYLHGQVKGLARETSHKLVSQATPPTPQHRMYCITGTQRKGLVHMPYSTCAISRFCRDQSEVCAVKYGGRCQEKCQRIIFFCDMYGVLLQKAALQLVLSDWCTSPYKQSGISYSFFCQRQRCLSIPAQGMASLLTLLYYQKLQLIPALLLGTRTPVGELLSAAVLHTYRRRI